jgi:hypothetical protein
MVRTMMTFKCSVTVGFHARDDIQECYDIVTCVPLERCINDLN